MNHAGLGYDDMQFNLDTKSRLFISYIGPTNERTFEKKMALYAKKVRKWTSKKLNVRT